ncbi:MAG: NAD(P)-binding protein [Pseudonocardiaceae bacterium]
MNRILIIGAGLAGLALASGLPVRGVEPVLVEQAPVISIRRSSPSFAPTRDRSTASLAVRCCC